jgi:thiol-disulfide isomerase/thioredoxin
MKKKLLTVLALLAFTITGFAQGIQFEYGDWSSVKAKAKKENKIIFIDFYTSWCGPCKMLSKNIFPQKAVGDFYNKNFINYKVDAEKGEGPKLAQKFGVKAYPTLIFADTNGEFLHQGVGGMQAEALIELGNTAMDPNKQLSNLLKDSETEMKDMPAHLRKLSQERLPYNDKFEAYINSLSKKELYSKTTYDLLVELGGRSAEGFTFNLILENKEAFAKAVGQKKVDGYFYNKYLMKAYTAKNKKQAVQPVFNEIKSKGFGFAEKIESTVRLTGYNYEGKYGEFLKEAPIYLEKYAKNDPALKYRTVFMEANKFANRSPELKKFAIQIAEELIAADYNVAKVNAYIGKQYADAGDLKTALTYYQKASDYNQKKGVEDQSAQSVDFLKKRIAIYEKGDYTFNISGLDEYNGFTFKLYYESADEIGEHIETPGVEIKDGKCTIKGNVKVPMTTGWSVYDGDDFKTKGSLILEPGEFKAKLAGRNLEVENGWYNYYVYQGLRENPKYKEAVKNMDEFNSKEGDMKDPAYRKEFFKIIGAVNDSEKEYYTSTYMHNADPTARVLAFYVGRLWHDENSEEEIKKLKADLGDHYLLKTIAHYKAENKRSKAMQESVAVGKQIKPFIAKDLNGKEFKLEKVLKINKYVLVEFWASWCGPCRGAIPHLKELHKKYQKEGFEIVSFSLDHKENMWRKASEKENIPWINTSDLIGRKSPIARMYGVAGVPYSLLVDRKGVIVFSQTGMSDKLDKKLEEVFDY